MLVGARKANFLRKDSIGQFLGRFSIKRRRERMAVPNSCVILPSAIEIKTFENIFKKKKKEFTNSV